MPAPNLDRQKLITLLAEGSKVEYLFFWGHTPPMDGSVSKACLSQWYPAPFVVDDLAYKTAEHWMMACKARLFNDAEVLEQIILAPDPLAAKALGRKVRNFDDKMWKANARRFVTEGNIAKFKQNPSILDFLLGTGDTIIVEAAPRDQIWGIGLGQDNPRALDPSTWRGQNLLGFALVDARWVLRNNGA
jgi:ribA/ribD-fused uncharacterized protein